MNWTKFDQSQRGQDEELTETPNVRGICRTCWGVPTTLQTFGLPRPEYGRHLAERSSPTAEVSAAFLLLVTEASVVGRPFSRSTQMSTR
jgi:hypothetical protein